MKRLFMLVLLLPALAYAITNNNQNVYQILQGATFISGTSTIVVYGGTITINGVPVLTNAPAGGISGTNSALHNISLSGVTSNTGTITGGALSNVTFAGNVGLTNPLAPAALSNQIEGLSATLAAGDNAGGRSITNAGTINADTLYAGRIGINPGTLSVVDSDTQDRLSLHSVDGVLIWSGSNLWNSANLKTGDYSTVTSVINLSNTLVGAIAGTNATTITRLINASNTLVAAMVSSNAALSNAVVTGTHAGMTAGTATFASNANLLGNLSPAAFASTGQLVAASNTLASAIAGKLDLTGTAPEAGHATNSDWAVTAQNASNSTWAVTAKTASNLAGYSAVLFRASAGTNVYFTGFSGVLSNAINSMTDGDILLLNGGTHTVYSTIYVPPGTRIWSPPSGTTVTFTNLGMTVFVLSNRSVISGLRIVGANDPAQIPLSGNSVFTFAGGNNALEWITSTNTQTVVGHANSSQWMTNLIRQCQFYPSGQAISWNGRSTNGVLRIYDSVLHGFEQDYSWPPPSVDPLIFFLDIAQNTVSNRIDLFNCAVGQVGTNPSPAGFKLADVRRATCSINFYNCDLLRGTNYAGAGTISFYGGRASPLVGFNAGTGTYVFSGLVTGSAPTAAFGNISAQTVAGNGSGLTNISATGLRFTNSFTGAGSILASDDGTNLYWRTGP